MPMKPLDIDQFLRIAFAFAPLISAAAAAVPGGEKIAPLVPVIIGAMAAAQQLHTTSGQGAVKKELVQQIVAASVQVANATSPVQIDPAAVRQITDKGIDAVILGINEAERVIAQQAQVPALPPPPLPFALPTTGSIAVP